MSFTNRFYIDPHPVRALSQGFWPPNFNPSLNEGVLKFAKEFFASIKMLRIGGFGDGFTHKNPGNFSDIPFDWMESVAAVG